MIDTKDKILDSAERLFGEQGYSETSLRHIIADAGVNLAAIHYHFGSKEDLLEQLIRRRADPINQVRLDALERFEADAGADLAAIHYHFGSKEDLLEQLIRRRADPINQVRLDALERFEADAGAD